VRGETVNETERNNNLIYIKTEITPPCLSGNPIQTLVTNRTEQYNGYYNAICHHNLVNIALNYDKMLKHQSLLAGYLNARSVKNKSTDISDFICDNKLDMCAISETWLRESDAIVRGDITPAGYKLLHANRVGKRGGGVAILHKESLPCKKQKTQTFSTFELLEVFAKSPTRNIRLCCVYRPPSGHAFSHFIDEFTVYLDQHATSTGNLLIVGDFNIHLNNKSDNKAITFSTLLNTMNLTQHVSAPTHDKGHTLDLIISRTVESTVERVDHHPATFSDHTPITFLVNAEKPHNQPKTISFRNIKIKTSIRSNFEKTLKTATSLNPLQIQWMD